MSVTVRIPGPLRRITNGVDALGSAMTPPSVSAATDALSMNAYPPQGSPLRTAASALMPHGAAIAALGLFLGGSSWPIYRISQPRDTLPGAYR